MTIEDDLRTLGAVPGITGAVLRATEARAVSPVPLGDRIRLHPATVGATAAFVRARSIDIATEPHLAAAAAARLPGAQLHPTSPATTMVRVDSALIAAHPDEVHDQLLRALDWRAHGPRWTLHSQSGASASAALAVPACCPLGHQLSANGTCFCD
ncbi:hypothetical protein [Kineococcus sp. NPDC059986]|uniref:hypothetical protein n=1 Tax=Kineococcus sp. NPDC059986 TaxID=3155538 RepID=UPI00344B613E